MNFQQTWLYWLAGAVLLVINVWATILGKLRQEAPLNNAAYDPAADRLPGDLGRACIEADLGELRERNRRGVRRKSREVGQLLLDRTQRFKFQVEDLGHRFDDQLAVGIPTACWVVSAMAFAAEMPMMDRPDDGEPRNLARLILHGIAAPITLEASC